MKINAEATGIVLKPSYNNEHYFLTYGNILRICRSQYAPIFLNEAQTIVYEWRKRFKSYDAVNQHCDYFLDRVIKWYYSYRLTRVLYIQQDQWEELVNISGILIPNTYDPLKKREQIFLNHTAYGINIFHNLISKVLANIGKVDIENTIELTNLIQATDLNTDILNNDSLNTFKITFMNEIIEQIQTSISNRDIEFQQAQDVNELSDMYINGSFILEDEI